MHISEIKALSQDYRFRGCVSEIWDIPGFALKLSALTFVTADDFYGRVKELSIDYLTRLANFDATQITKEQKHIRRKIRNSLEDLSKVLYQDKNYWKQGIDTSSILAPSPNPLWNKRQALEELSFFSKRGIISQEHFERKPNILYKITRDKEIYDAVMQYEKEHGFSNLGELYEVLERAVDLSIEEHRLTYTEILTMECISYLYLGNYHEWFAHMHLDYSTMIRDYPAYKDKFGTYWHLFVPESRRKLDRKLNATQTENES